MVLKNGVKNIKDAAYSGTRTVCQVVFLKFYKCNLLIFAVNDQKLALIESKVDQCAAQNDLMLLENNFSKKSDEFNQMFSNMNEQVHSRFELQVGHSILIPSSTLGVMKPKAMKKRQGEGGGS